MERIELMVPTCNRKGDEESVWLLPNLHDPSVPVAVEQTDGMRILLGTHDSENLSKPEIQIQRRNNGWMISLHPTGSFDESGYVFFLDDGRSFVVSERFAGTVEPIEMLEYVEDVEEVDAVKAHDLISDPAIILKMID